MKCRNCNYAKRGYFQSLPDAYVCIGVKEPFVIEDYLNAECTEYKDENTKSIVDDGIYIELFAMKDGVRYNTKIVNMKDVSVILTNSLMDGIEKLWA